MEHLEKFGEQVNLLKVARLHFIFVSKRGKVLHKGCDSSPESSLNYVQATALNLLTPVS